ncbi:MAG: LysR family transcriptional regulator [Eubacteriaceae bacterium]|jgi:DNA-binding transcriptional LysR family regulator|nr:LysR family transcriptional regulator [Eubacteriaceae bacterium]
MTLRQLRYIVEVSNCTSLTQAANNLFIAQPSLSNAIHELENELGFKILNRSRRGITFTREGMDFVLYAAQVLNQADALYDRFSKTRSANAKTLNVTGHHYIFVAEAVSTFVNSLDSDTIIKIHYREGSTSVLIDDISTRRSEIGIIFLSDINRGFMTQVLKENNMEFHHLFSSHPCAYISRNHPLAGQNSVTLDDLAPYPYICYEQDVDSPRFAEEVLSPPSPKQIIYAHNSLSMMHIIDKTQAYNIGSGSNTGNEEYNKICMVPIRNIVKSMQIGWINLKNQPLSESAEMFIEHLQRAAANATFIKA